jgi:speckle-type POZ protein
MATCWESGFIEFKLDFAGTKNLAIGDIVHSDDFSAGGHIWRVRCYPHGNKADNNGEYLSVFLRLVSESKNVKAIFECFVMGRDGTPSSSHASRCVQVYPPEGFNLWGFPEFVKRSVLESDYVKDGCVTFMFGVIVLQQDNPITLPASDIADHLGHLLDHTDGSEAVTFSVGGQKFHAHRAVLAARSPVFKAQLFGSMADAKMRCITLHDIKPATFQILLRFMYTDALPQDVDEGLESSSSIELFQNLLAAADMYHLDRLKLMCARKLWDCVSAETVAKVLICAEMYLCPELKRLCLDFFVVEKNSKIAVLTEGYFQLMQSFPSVIDEIRTRRGFVRQA